MKESYTMEEFIEEFKLGVPLHDAGATRQIAKRLKELGYKKARGTYKGEQRVYWTKRDVRAKTDLGEKLRAIK